MEGKLEEILKTYEKLSRCGEHFAVQSVAKDEVCFPLRDFFFFTTEGAPKGNVMASTAQGELALRPMETLPVLEARLASYPQFVRTHSSYLVNMDCVERVAPVSAREHALTMKGMPDRTIPVTEFYQERVKAALGLESLDHVIPWNEQLAAIIKEKLRTFDKDIRYMSVEELRANFSKSTGEIAVRQLMGNIIWQAYNWIQKGLIPHFEGNIRSFWYSHIKPVLARLGVNLKDQYKLMSDVFVDYTAYYRLFKYKDFGFADDNELYRKIGKVNAPVIVCAEKVGHWKTLQLLHEQYDVTIIALGGQPSQLTTEYFMDELEHAVSMDEDFYLFAIVDYDPSGWIIAESFATQLGIQGLRNIKNVVYDDDPWDVKDVRPCQLIMPVYFTPEEIELNKYEVPQDSPDQVTKAKNWLAKGGGINGEAFGLEADAMERTKLRALFYEKAKKYLKPVKPPDRGRKMLRHYGKAGVV
jgi:hypothetical protein